MRELHGHKVNGCNENLQIVVCDEPGSGGACHHYQVINVENQNKVGDYVACDIEFQNGPIKEVGTNGITHEVLLAILIDRLQSFQNGKPGELNLSARGPYACRENAIALTKLEEAAMWLQKRTSNRLSRGVEGTHTV